MKHYLGICLVLVTIAVLVLGGIYTCSQVADRTVDHVKNAFAEVLNIRPQVTINQQVILTQTSPIAELAIVSKEALVTIGFTQHLEVMSFQVPLTEKSLKVEGTYRFKAGFNLQQPFTVEIDPSTHIISAHFPRAQILSVERVGDLSFHGDDSALNRLNDDDRQKMLNALDNLARSTAYSSTLRSEAETQIVQRLTQILAHNGEKFQASWETVPLSPAEKP